MSALKFGAKCVTQHATQSTAPKLQGRKCSFAVASAAKCCKHFLRQTVMVFKYSRGPSQIICTFPSVKVPLKLSLFCNSFTYSCISTGTQTVPMHNGIKAFRLHLSSYLIHSTVKTILSLLKAANDYVSQRLLVSC
jgi:hypothetical protein